ncbi:MAG: hypothetical protein WEB60_04405, partial [Terrimicrobiaceae bacterium]
MTRLIAGGLALGALAFWLSKQHFPQKPKPVRTVKEAVKEFSPTGGQRVRQRFEARGVAYPPARVLIIALKREMKLEIYAANSDEPWTWVHTYPILASSGHEGPKLQEGDRQVPEGFYRIELLNPNSRYHLSLRVNYPSPHDIQRA